MSEIPIDGSQCSRRQFLTVATTVSITGLAGCSTDSLGEEDAKKSLGLEDNRSGWQFVHGDVAERRRTPDAIPVDTLAKIWDHRFDRAIFGSGVRPAQFNSDQVFTSFKEDVFAFSHDGEREFTKSIDSIGEFYVRDSGLRLQTEKRFLELDSSGERNLYNEFPTSGDYAKSRLDLEPHPEQGKNVFVLHEKTDDSKYHPKKKVTIGVVDAAEANIEWSETLDWTREDAGVGDSYGSAFSEPGYRIDKTLVNPSGDTLIFSVYVTSAESKGTEWDKVVALDLQTGETRWQTNAETRHLYAMTDSHILVADFEPYVFKKIRGWYTIDVETGEETPIDEGGDTLPTGPVPNNSGRTKVYHPALDGTTAFMPKDDSLLAIDVTTGDVEWKYLSTGTVTSAPAVGENAIVFGNENGIEIVDRKGEQLASVNLDDEISTPIAMDGDRIYAVGASIHALGPEEDVPESPKP